ncbi:hypothetical protein CEXT_163531 [Caerostris extrusa]|uniref:FCH domain-containing protein n=1 Tax=Caerostris extrusa TaxID=172846 RepID=A0AAV4RNI5_CAEEX|nr:hypothetical protein CEXT_163531 [Caerostris extrusa]
MYRITEFRFNLPFRTESHSIPSVGPGIQLKQTMPVYCVQRNTINEALRVHAENIDQYDNLGLHTQKGIEFAEKFGSFVKEKSTIESEYAHKLRKLVKNYLPKKKDEEES